MNDLPCRPLDKLPTLQRNALRKLFDRAEFTPEEVASLGFRRIQHAEGIGLKGMATIQGWLKEYGIELQPEPGSVGHRSRPGSRARRSLEVALRVVQNHGYIVHGPDGESPDQAEKSSGL